VRIDDFIQGLTAQNPDAALIVAHAGVVRAALAVLGHCDPEAAFDIAIPPGSVTTTTQVDGVWRVERSPLPLAKTALSG